MDKLLILQIGLDKVVEEGVREQPILVQELPHSYLNPLSLGYHFGCDIVVRLDCSVFGDLIHLGEQLSNLLRANLGGYCQCTHRPCR